MSKVQYLCDNIMRKCPMLWSQLYIMNIFQWQNNWEIYHLSIWLKCAEYYCLNFFILFCFQQMREAFKEDNTGEGINSNTILKPVSFVINGRMRMTQFVFCFVFVCLFVCFGGLVFVFVLGSCFLFLIMGEINFQLYNFTLYQFIRICIKKQNKNCQNIQIKPFIAWKAIFYIMYTWWYGHS